MNRHFEDTLYYLKRAGTTVKRGVLVEVEPLTSKVESVTGDEPESEAGRLDDVRATIGSTRTKVQSEARQVVGAVRETIGQRRGT